MDGDGDNVPDNFYNCPLASNPAQGDTDQDGLGDACDADGDNDGVLNAADNCVLVANRQQQDFDRDGLGNACDSFCCTVPSASGCAVPQCSVPTDAGSCW